MEIYKQNFIPASKGLIKSAPSSLIPDGAFQETMNVRFGDGYVEKVEGFKLFDNSSVEGFDNSVMYIGQYITNDSQAYSVIHTRDGVYFLNDGYQYDEQDTGTNWNFSTDIDPYDPDPSGGGEGGEGGTSGKRRIIIIQSPHQTIKVFVFKQIYEQTEYSFYTMRGATVQGDGWMVQASIKADAGYMAGTLNYQYETEVQGDIIIQATEATQILGENDKLVTLYWNYTYESHGLPVWYSNLDYEEGKDKTGQNGMHNDGYDHGTDYVVTKPLGRNIYYIYCSKEVVPQRLYNIFNAHAHKSQYIPDMTDLVFDLQNKRGLVIISGEKTSWRNFHNNEWLENITFKRWNTYDVEYISNLVTDCVRLKSIGDISNWDTSNLLSAYNLVESTQYLTSLDLSGWATPLLQSATNIFSGSYAKILDISNWSTQHLTEFSVGGSNMEYLIMDKDEIKFSGELRCHHPNNYIKYLVPESMVDAYKQHSNWSEWADQIDSIDNYIIERYNGQIIVTPREA